MSCPSLIVLRRAAGLLVVALGLLLAGCSGGAGGGGVDTDPIRVTLASAGGATTVAAGGTLELLAFVENARTPGVSWSLTGTGCPAACGTLVAGSDPLVATYQAPAIVTTAFTVTVTATSTEDPTKGAALDLTVQARICPANAGLLAGQYAFLLQGFEQGSRIGVALIGSVSVDACGNVTGGTIDYFFGPALAGRLDAVTGQYTVGPDRRGTLSLGFGATTRHFAIALGRLSAGVAQEGSINATDSGGSPALVLSGSLWRQDPAAFVPGAVSGPYAFVLNGWRGAGPREAMGGSVVADGSGALGSGLLDRKAFGFAPVSDVAWSGSLGAPSAAGRAALTATALTGTGTAVLYVVDAGHLLAMISDTTGSGRVYGGALRAQHGPFDTGSLSGPLVTYQTSNYDLGSFDRLTTSTLSLFQADGAGTLNMRAVDQEYGGSVISSANPGLTYTYSVSTRGHATVIVNGADGGRWYLTGPNTALMLGFDTGVSVGAIEPQSGAPFTAATLAGTYFAAQAPGGSAYSMASSGVAVADGSGNLASTIDINLDALLVVVRTQSGPIAVAANGRITDAYANVIYAISPSRFVMLALDPAAPTFGSSVVQVFQK